MFAPPWMRCPSSQKSFGPSVARNASQSIRSVPCLRFVIDMRRLVVGYAMKRSGRIVSNETSNSKNKHTKTPRTSNGTSAANKQCTSAAGFLTTPFSFVIPAFDCLRIASGHSGDGILAAGGADDGGDLEDRSVLDDGVVGVVTELRHDDRDLGEVGGVLRSRVSTVTLRWVAGDMERGAGGAFIRISWSEILKVV